MGYLAKYVIESKKGGRIVKTEIKNIPFTAPNDNKAYEEAIKLIENLWTEYTDKRKHPDFTMDTDVYLEDLTSTLNPFDIRPSINKETVERCRSYEDYRK